MADPNNTNSSVITAIVPDGTKDVKVNFTKDPAGADNNYAKATLNGDKIKKFDGASYTIKSVDEPTTLNVAYSKEPTVSVTLNGGTLDTDASDELWTEETAGTTWKTSVEANGDLKVVFRADAEGTGIQSVMINGVAGDRGLIAQEADGSYVYTVKSVQEATNIVVTFAVAHTVTFTDADGTALENGTTAVVDGLTIPKAVFQTMEGKLSGKEGQKFYGWETADGTVYTTVTKVSGDVTLQAVYKENVSEGTNKDPNTGLSAVIAANGFTIHVDNVSAIDAQNAVKRAGVKAVGSDGEVITQIADTTRNADSKITVSGLDKLKAAKKAGTYNLTFQAEDAKVTVQATVVDMQPTVTGKTANTLTFTGEPGTEYTVTDKNGNPVLDENGQEIKVTTGADGKGFIKGLEKGKDYVIRSAESGKIETSTSAVDAEDIANSFRESETDTAQVSGSGKDEKASNSKVDVVVGEDGNYKVILKDTINGTVTVPDNWGNVNVDLNGNDIKGPNATDKSPAGAGLVIKKDETGTGTAGGKNPGTILGITDSTGKGEIKGGDGSTKYPDGASGIETGTGKDKPENAGIIIGTGATVSGGNGATGSDGNGGTGGNGISGSVDTKVDGGSVSGGNGGAGADTDKGNGGNGGQGGAGIKTDNKPVDVDKGTVSGGAGGNGGSSTDPSGGNGGNAGNGGTGIDSGKGDITIDKDGNTTGGSGGAGGNASSAGGNGGNGGQGGNAANGSLDKDHAQGSVTGGAGGNGGNADKGTAGAGGAGGSTGIAGDAAKGESGTAGVGKKDDGNGNGKGDGEKDNGTGTVKKTTKTVTTVKKAVRTGDVAPIWLLVALLAVSAGAVTTVGVRRRKRK